MRSHLHKEAAPTFPASTAANPRARRYVPSLPAAIGYHELVIISERRQDGKRPNSEVTGGDGIAQGASRPSVLVTASRR